MQQPEQKSKYNEAISQILRIGSLWDSCHYYRKKGNLTQWNMNLDCVWMELIADTKPSKKTKDDDIKDSETTISNFNKDFIKYKDRRDIIFQVLMKKESFLRRLQNKQGKGASYADPDEDDM